MSLENIANTILPYTPGSTFTVENAYMQNGIAPQPLRNQVQSNETNETDEYLSILEVVRKIWWMRPAYISDAKIKEKAQTIWGFGSQSISLRCLSKPSFVIIDKMEALWH